MDRCINIDWLECHCIEPDGVTLNAEYFISDGWHVNERPYGTRTYREMFTLYDYITDEPLIEIRRDPVGAKFTSSVQVIDPHSCHIRLHNRTCYYNNAAALLWEFIVRYNYIFMRISRIDICLDFEFFDSLDNPQSFVTRYLKGQYAKINVTDLRAVGKDLWDGRNWNSLSWGSPHSQIGTKLYNKTLELKTCKDKPYIRQAWAVAGLVDDFIELTKQAKDGTIYKPVIWRLEFSIRSSVKKWFRMEHDTTGHKSTQSVYNTLDCYFTRQQLLDVFSSLVDHYFHFKHVVEKPTKGLLRQQLSEAIPWRDRERNLQRKDRCPDKKLFDFKKEQQVFYKVERVASATPADRSDLVLIRKLEEYKLTHPLTEIIAACDTIIADLKAITINKAASNPSDKTEIALLRQLIALRIKATDKAAITMESVRAISQIWDDLGEPSTAQQGGTVVPPPDFQGPKP